MEIPTDYTKKFNSHSPRGPRSSRDELIGLFLDHGIKLTDTTTKRLRAATGRDLGIILSIIPTDDLYNLYQQCARARSFSRYFWWAIRPQGAVRPVQKRVAEPVGDGDDLPGMREGGH